MILLHFMIVLLLYFAGRQNSSVEEGIRRPLILYQVWSKHFTRSQNLFNA